MKPMLSIRDLGVAYRRDGQEVVALEGIDLDVGAGEKLAVIGESGSGKSTLALAIAGLLPASAKLTGTIAWPGLGLSLPATRSTLPPSVLPDISPTRGEIGSFGLGASSATSAIGESKAAGLISPPEGEMSGRTEGGNVEEQLRRNWHSRTTPVNGRDIGFVFQDPSASLDPVLTVGEQIAEVAHAHRGVGWRQAYAIAEELLGRVKLPEPAIVRKAYPHQLSGGQKQRVAIAAAIAGKPQLLIADEATSALDTIVQQDIVALIRQLAYEDGMSLLFITHDIALASEIADRIAVFRHGRLVETGETRRLIASPRDVYTQSLLDAHLGLEDVSQ